MRSMIADVCVFLCEKAEKVREANRVAALYSPEKAEEHRNAGNEKFKADLYADAVKEYTTAITHNPKDPRIYSNRAACFTKLMALPSALKGKFDSSPSATAR